MAKEKPLRKKLIPRGTDTANAGETTSENKAKTKEVKKDADQ